MGRKKKETILGVPVIEEVKPKKRVGRKKKAEVVEKAVLAPVSVAHAEPKVTISDNHFFNDDNRSVINISKEENLEAATVEAARSAIYVSPALISITNATILTGNNAALWNRYWTVRMRWTKLVEGVRRFFRHLVRVKKQ